MSRSPRSGFPLSFGSIGAGIHPARGPVGGAIVVLARAARVTIPCDALCVVPGEGLEPPRLAAADFKSAASTNSATRARDRIRPATYTERPAASRRRRQKLGPISESDL